MTLFQKTATGSEPTTKVTSKKVEIYLTKADPSIVWDAIEEVTNEKISVAKAQPSNAYAKDWNTIVEELNENEKSEANPDDLFKKIFADASDDQRRAMMKSYQTSGGTVLSTNWDEVKERDYEKEMEERIEKGEFKKY